MPIRLQTNASSLKRYCVFSIAEDREALRKNEESRFPECPLTSVQEAATKLAHSEHFHNKRLRSLERQVIYPYVDATFFSSYQSVDEIAQSIKEDDCKNFHLPHIRLEKACYEEVQIVDPKRDMIQTPIDEDPHSIIEDTQQRQAGNKPPTPDNDKRNKGFIIIAFKTMEDMDKHDFVHHWKTWTGVRYMCTQLPRELNLRRIAFYRRITKTSSFMYVLLIELSNLLDYAATTLNQLDCMKLRLCGYLCAYRHVDYKFDPVTEKFFGGTDRRFSSGGNAYASGKPVISITKEENGTSEPPKHRPVPPPPAEYDEGNTTTAAAVLSRLQQMTAAEHPSNRPLPQTVMQGIRSSNNVIRLDELPPERPPPPLPPRRDSSIPRQGGFQQHIIDDLQVERQSSAIMDHLITETDVQQRREVQSKAAAMAAIAAAAAVVGNSPERLLNKCTNNVASMMPTARQPQRMHAAEVPYRPHEERAPIARVDSITTEFETSLTEAAWIGRSRSAMDSNDTSRRSSIMTEFSIDGLPQEHYTSPFYQRPIGRRPSAPYHHSQEPKSLLSVPKQTDDPRSQFPSIFAVAGFEPAALVARHLAGVPIDQQGIPPQARLNLHRETDILDNYDANVHRLQTHSLPRTHVQDNEPNIYLKTHSHGPMHRQSSSMHSSREDILVAELPMDPRKRVGSWGPEMEHRGRQERGMSLPPATLMEQLHQMPGRPAFDRARSGSPSQRRQLPEVPRHARHHQHITIPESIQEEGQRKISAEEADMKSIFVAAAAPIAMQKLLPVDPSKSSKVPRGGHASRSTSASPRQAPHTAKLPATPTQTHRGAPTRAKGIVADKNDNVKRAGIDTPPLAQVKTAKTGNITAGKKIRKVTEQDR